jgi:serine/threonine protein kinase/tetratricopeptide (TPR) repeat protein
VSTPHGDTLIRPSVVQPIAGPLGGPAGLDVLSGYEILGVLGRGGMGVVYKARQLGLNRIVALKMILHGSHASVEEVVRFKIEAEAVAALHHPNIVQIHEIGDRGGRPFFSLEYVEGGSLQQRLDGNPLPSRTAAALIEKLARAMDHAHRRGIVHRDLKPGNILLVESLETPLEACTPRITDFGLAKILEDDQAQTGTGATLGTPAYMAPEQAAGKTREVGPAADTYALGAILYDLLTGRPPFKGNTVLDTLHMVQQAEPVPPRRLQPRCPLDLQTICLKCLEKDPARRYGSAGELADDLGRFLEGRPIEARPTTWRERAWKWARRRPTVAALLALSAVSTVLVVAVSTYSAVQVSQANSDLRDRNEELNDARDELQSTNTTLEATLRNEKALRTTAQVQRDRADAAEKEARKQEKDAQDSFLSAQGAVVNLLDLIRQRLRNEPGTEHLRRDLLAKAVQMYQEFTTRPSQTPASRHRAARAHVLMANLQAELGKHADAEKNYRTALALYEELIEETRDQKGQPDYRSEAMAAAMHLWGLLEGIDADRAEKMLAEVRRRVEAATPEQKRDPVARHIRAVVLANQAIHHQNRAQYHQARVLYTQAASELAGLDGPEEVILERGRVDVNRAALFLVSATTGSTAKRRDDLQKAAGACARAVGTLSKLLEANPADTEAARELGRAYTHLGLVRLGQKESAGASKVYRKAVQLFERLTRDHSDIVDYRHLLAVALGNQGLQLVRERALVEAQKALRKGRELLEELVKGFSDVAVYREDLARVCNSLGLAYLEGGQLARAEEPLATAVRYLEAEANRDPRRKQKLQVELLAVYQNLIVCHTRRASAISRLQSHIASLDAQLAARAEPHVRALVDVQQKRVDLLKLPLPASSAWPARAGRWVETLLARADLARTLRAQGSVLALEGKHQAAAATIDRVRKLVATSWPGWIESARLLCRCIRLAEKDDRLGQQERAALVRRYGEEALSLVEGLAGRTPELAEELKHADFQPLRERPFRQRYQLLLSKAMSGDRGPGR